jgi:hypothetical protein
MSQVMATCFPVGVTGPHYTSAIRESRENDIPTVEHIGEAVHEAVNYAWKNGNDPCGKDFVVLVSFH